MLWDKAFVTAKICHSYWFKKMLIGQYPGGATRLRILGRGKAEMQLSSRHRGMPYREKVPNHVAKHR